MYYDDFYDEPSEFDIQVAEFKKSLMNSVKEEFLSEMEQLKKENEELQDVKDNFEEIKREYNQKKQQLEFERGNLRQEVRRERLSKLMQDFQVIMYRACAKYEKPQKCDKCDGHRKIKYKTPLGRDAYENCTCNNGKTVYCPEEYICSEFRINRDNNGIIAWYKQKSNRDYDYYTEDSSIHAESIFNSEMEYEGLNYYRTFFKTKEECQKYCDYLNTNEE